MAPVIWGLDLREMQWSKFKSSYMWNKEYHMRRTKFIVYQLAMILCVISESLGTAALSDKVHQQDFIESHSDHKLSEYNDDYIGAASYNIFVGVYVATIFGSGFFFDLFWPERRENKGVKLAWKICSVIACVFVLSSGLCLTIITAKNSARVTPIPGATVTPAEITAIQKAAGGPALKYSHDPRAIASVSFLWPGFVATIASTIILWRAQDHIDVYGPRSMHARMETDISKERASTSGPRQMRSLREQNNA